MKFTKKKKQFIELAINYYWDVWNIIHPDNNKEKDISEKILEEINPANKNQTYKHLTETKNRTKMKFLQELKFKNIEQILWLDIETATIEKELTEESRYWNAWEQKTRYDDTVQTTEDCIKRYSERAPLYKEFAQIVSVSYGRVKNGVLKVKTLTGQEKDILEELFSDVEQFVGAGVGFLGVFSGKQFDIPFINFRAVVHSILMIPSFDIGGLAPWNIKHIIDVQDLLRGSSSTNISIEGACAAFGIKSPKKGEVTGKGVSEAYWNGNIKAIAEYNPKDVLATCNVFCHLIGEPKVKMEEIQQVKVEKVPVLSRILNQDGVIKKADVEELKALKLTKEEKVIALELVQAAFGESPKKKLEKEIVEIFVK